jgi:hypothetical protein
VSRDASCVTSQRSLGSLETPGVASSSVAAGELLQETRLQTNPLHALLQASDSRARGGRAGGRSANLQEFPKPGPTN